MRRFAARSAAGRSRPVSYTHLSRATVNTVIAGGKGEITGNFTADEAKNLATLILSGALPLNLTQLEVSAISATLGVEALDRAIQAGVIGVILVMLFMLFRYRLCGLDVYKRQRVRCAKRRLIARRRSAVKLPI